MSVRFMPFMVCPYFRDSTVLLLLCFNTHSHTTINIKSNWDISLPVSYCWWFLFDGDRRTAQLPLFIWYRCIHRYRIMILNHGLLICYSQKKLPCNTEIVWYIPNMLVWYVLNHDQSLFVIGPIILFQIFTPIALSKMMQDLHGLAHPLFSWMRTLIGSFFHHVIYSCW